MHRAPDSEHWVIAVAWSKFMPKITYIQRDGVLYEKGTEPYTPHFGSGPAVIGDEPDFVSPVDRQVYSGRAGMREHNARNDVVNNRDLVGLPTLKTNSDLRSPEQKKQSAQHRKQTIINEVNKHYR
jgi:hypothetical protein